MLGIATAALGFIGRVPHSLVLKAAIVGLAFTIGLGLGNHWATRGALERQRVDLLRYAADREAAVGEAYAKAATEHNKKLAEERERAAKADEASHTVYQAGLVAAARARANAERVLESERANLTKLTETNDGLRKVNELLVAMPADPGCVLSYRVRLALDAASGATPDSDAGDPAPGPASGIDGSAAAASPITCQQLASGYAALGEHDRLMRAWVMAWQAWAETALR